MNGLNQLIPSPLVNSIRLLLALALTAPLIVAAEPLPAAVYHFVVGKALWTRTLTELAFALWLVLLLRDPAYRPPRSWLLAIFGGYLLIALLAAWFGVSPTLSMWSSYERMDGWVGLAHWFAYLLVLVSVFRAWRQWRALLNFNVAVGLLVGLLGLYEYFRLGPFHYVNWDSARISITFGNPTYVAAYAAVNIFIAAALLFSSFFPDPADTAALARAQRRRRERAVPWWRHPANGWRLFWLTAILLSLVILWLSGSRGGPLSVGIGGTAAGLAYALWGRGRLRRTAAALIGPAMVLALAVFALLPVNALAPPGQEYLDDPEASLYARLQATLRDLSVEHRIEAFRVGYAAVRERPLLGWGPENFSVIHERYVSARISALSETSFDRAHNKLLEEATTTGILGLLAYLSLWGWLLWAFLRQARRLPLSRRVFLMLVGGGLAAHFTHNMFLFDTPGTRPQWYVLVGFIVFVAAQREPAAAAGDATTTAAPSKPSVVPQRLTAALSAIGLNTAAAVAIALIIALFAAYYLNYRAYAAANQALVILNYGRSWEERFAAMEHSAAWSRELANQSRRMMFQEINFRWHSMNPDQTELAIGLAERHGPTAVGVEPQEWRLYAWQADIYRRAPETTPERLGKARELIDQAAALAPTNVEVQRRLAAQYTAEGDWPGGQRVIADYLSKTPEAAEHFDDLQQDIAAALEKQGKSNSGE